MQVEPQVEHQWLDNLLGDWTTKMESDLCPDKPNEPSSGTEKVKRLGDVWVLCDMEWPMPDGQTAISQMTLGYDPQKKTFVGTFVSSCMTHLWVYESGTLDDAGKVLTLNSTGPNFNGTGMTQFQDIIEIVDEDHRLLRAMMLDENEVWQEFMVTSYIRNR